jgi:predicted dehydrogenase
MHRIGILGAAGIAPRAIIDPARRRSDTVVAAVASRSKASSYAAENGIPTAYGSYGELLADPSIDLVYNALPPTGHAEWSIKALAAGKHVLCEKPFAVTAGEARAMVAAAQTHGCTLMEAFHDRYHPAFLHLLALKPRLGAIRAISAAFHVDIPYDPTNLRYDPMLGGGAMMDLGCYPLHWLRSFMGSEPEVISVAARVCELGSDTRIDAQLLFGDVPATLVADIQDPPFRGLFRIEAANGVVELDNPCLPHVGHSFRETLGGVSRIYTVAGGTTYDYQLEALLAAVDTGAALPSGGVDAVGNMIALDQIYEKAGIDRPAARGRG